MSGVLDNAELTYGEAMLIHFVPVIAFLEPKAGEIFWDLGCGAGRPLAIAAANFPQLGVCRGVELLEDLASHASQVATNLTTKCGENNLAVA